MIKRKMNLKIKTGLELNNECYHNVNCEEVSRKFPGLASMIMEGCFSGLQTTCQPGKEPICLLFTDSSAGQQDLIRIAAGYGKTVQVLTEELLDPDLDKTGAFF